jgi:hypothetical protein
MIDKLKFLIDGCEDNPKLKEMLLKVVSLPENKQDDALKLIELVVGFKR